MRTICSITYLLWCTPAVVFKFNKVLAVWNTLQQTITEPFELLWHFNKADLEYAIYNAATDSWSATLELTDDDFSDTNAVIAEDEVTDNVMAVWIKDHDGSFFTFDDSQMYYSIWDGTSWTTPSVILEGLLIFSIDVAFENSKAVVAFAHQNGPGQTAVSLVEFENNSWGTPQQVSDGTNGSHPAVELNNGNGIVLWEQNIEDEVFPTIFYSTFASTLNPKQLVTKTDSILDLDSTTFGDSTVVVWSESNIDGSSLHYGVFDGINWQLFTALKKTDVEFPLLSTTSDLSTQRLHIAYYEDVQDQFDLAFYRTTLTGSETNPYDPPQEPVPDETTCLPPTSGDWIIDSSCTLENSASAPANVIVKSGVVFTIPNGLSLTLLSSNSLTVESGGRVSVVFGGNILFT